MTCAKVAAQIEITETAWVGRRLGFDGLHQAESDVGSFDTSLDMCRGFTTLALDFEFRFEPLGKQGWVCQPGMAHFDHLIWPPQVKKSSSSSRLSFFCVCWLLFCASILQVVYRCRHDRIFHLSRLFEGFGILVPNLAELLDLLAKVFRVPRREGLLLDF